MALMSRRIVGKFIAATSSVGYRLCHFEVKADNFTPLAHQAIVDSTKVAIQHRQKFIEPECLTLSLLYQKNGIVGKVLEELDVDPEFLKIMILEFIRHQPETTGSTITDYLDSAARFFHLHGFNGMSTSIKTVKNPKSRLAALLKESRIHMVRTGDSLVGEEHLLMSYTNEPRLGKDIFTKLRVTDRCIGYAAHRVLNKTTRIVGYTGQRF